MDEFMFRRAVVAHLDSIDRHLEKLVEQGNPLVLNLDLTAEQQPDDEPAWRTQVDVVLDLAKKGSEDAMEFGLPPGGASALIAEVDQLGEVPWDPKLDDATCTVLGNSIVLHKGKKGLWRHTFEPAAATS